MPKVSVVTAVYNGGTYLRETVASILNQTFRDIEYILVDDASTDDSVAIVRSFDDPRIRLLVNERNRRLVATRNRGIAAARGEYIALSDHDDVSLPTRLADQVTCFEANPGIGLLGTWYDFINLSGRPNPRRTRRRYTPEECRASLLYRNPFGNSTLMVRRAALPDPPYDPAFPLAEDYHFIMRISRTHHIWMLPEVLVLYRLTRTSYSNFAAAQQFELSGQIKRELLHRLGVEPTPREFDVHRTLEADHLPVDAALLREIRLWLEALVAANARACAYEADAFDKIAGNEWYEFCRRASRLGAASWNEYRRSDLARRSHYRAADQMGLLLRCAAAPLTRRLRGRAARSSSAAA